MLLTKGNFIHVNGQQDKTFSFCIIFSVHTTAVEVLFRFSIFVTCSD